jgi:hypothetical protein
MITKKEYLKAKKTVEEYNDYKKAKHIIYLYERDKLIKKQTKCIHDLEFKRYTHDGGGSYYQCKKCDKHL